MNRTRGMLWVLVVCLAASTTAFAVEAYIPDVKGGEGGWQTYLQVYSQEPAETDFIITLYSNGEHLYSGVFSIDAFSETIIDLDELIPGVSTGLGVVSFDTGRLTFQLWYQHSEKGGTAEYLLPLEESSLLGFYSSSFRPDMTWRSVSAANLVAAETEVTWFALGGGGILGTATKTIPPFSKTVSLYSELFPQVNANDIASLVAVSTQEISGVSLSGNSENSVLLATAAVELSDFESGQCDTVAAVKSTGACNGTTVVLSGTVIERKDSDDYVFADTTGRIDIEYEGEGELPLSTPIEITGEVENGGHEIEVSSFRLLN